MASFIQEESSLKLKRGSGVEGWESETNMTDAIPYKTEEGMVCIVCQGFFPFLAKDAYGLRLNRNHSHIKEIPDFFICWECVHWLFKKFSDQLSGLSYTLLSSIDEEKAGLRSKNING
jgi:hypothetical protein